MRSMAEVDLSTDLDLRGGSFSELSWMITW